MQSISRHRAALAFIYAGEAVSGRPGSEPREAQRRIERRPAHEQEYRETLRRLGFKPATRRSDALEESAGEMFELPGDNAWLHFMQDDLPRLRQQGWFIDIRADFAYDLTPIDAWYAEVEEADDRQWFELELGIQVAGQRVSLLPALTEPDPPQPGPARSARPRPARRRRATGAAPGTQPAAARGAALRPPEAGAGGAFRLLPGRPRTAAQAAPGRTGRGAPGRSRRVAAGLGRRRQPARLRPPPTQFPGSSGDPAARPARRTAALPGSKA